MCGVGEFLSKKFCWLEFQQLFGYLKMLNESLIKFFCLVHVRCIVLNCVLEHGTLDLRVSGFEPHITEHGFKGAEMPMAVGLFLGPGNFIPGEPTVSGRARGFDQARLTVIVTSGAYVSLT